MIKTTAQLQQRFVEISEDNSFPKNFGTGENLIGLPPNDIYQLGFAAAFFECNRAVNQYVNGQAEEEKSWKSRCEELEVVAAALYLHQDGCRDQFEMYRSVYLVPDFSRKSITCPRCGIVRNEGEMRICCM